MQKKLFSSDDKRKKCLNIDKKKKDKKTTWNARVQACRPLETEDGGRLQPAGHLFLSKGGADERYTRLPS